MLLNHLFSSLARLFVGYSLASICGIALGVVLSARDIRFVRIMMGMPTLAWMPVFLVVFGLGDNAVIAAIFISAIFVIMLNTAHGIQQIDGDVIGAAMLDGAGGFVLLKNILIPCSIISIVSGLRLAIGYSWRALVGAEMLAVMIRYGLGKLLWESRYWSDFRMMAIGLFTIAIVGSILDKGLTYLEKTA